MIVTAPDGCHLEAEALGPPGAPPVLLVAGLGATRHGWRWQVPELFASPGEAAALGFCDSLAGDLRVAVFDNRGVGRSARAAGPRSIAQMGDDAVAVGEAALGAPFHLVGVSMGGMVALEVVLRHPSEVTTLTLLCTSAGGTALTPPRQEVLDAWANVNGLDEKALGWENAVLGYSDRFVTERRDVVEHCMEFDLAHPVDRDRWLDQAQAASAHDVVDRLVEISLPTLVICGTDDRVLPVENSRYLASRIPGARFVEIEGAGHGVNIEAARRVNALIREHVHRN